MVGHKKWSNKNHTEPTLGRRNPRIKKPITLKLTITQKTYLTNHKPPLTSQTMSNNIKALDLTTEVPRSPRETMAGYVIAGRMLDKCRSVIADTAGEYHFDCPLDNVFLDFTGISADDFKAFVATGADDQAVTDWIKENAKEQSIETIVQWNNDLRYKRINEMPVNLQVFLEGYIPENIPSGRIVYYWFDIYDIEEGRI